jgi:hypothetical protein
MPIFCWPLSLLLTGCPATEELKRETVEVIQSIDCHGAQYNDGAPVNLLLRKDNTTIRRCIVNGSIMAQGSNAQLWRVTADTVMVSGVNTVIADSSFGTITMASTSGGTIVRHSAIGTVTLGGSGNQIVANAISGPWLFPGKPGDLIRGNIYRR